MSTFLALLRRDLLVARRAAAFYLVSALTQPILVVLVFGNILPRIGLVADQFRTVMLPGLMSITMLRMIDPATPLQTLIPRWKHGLCPDSQET